MTYFKAKRLSFCYNTKRCFHASMAHAHTHNWRTFSQNILAWLVGKPHSISARLYFWSYQNVLLSSVFCSCWLFNGFLVNNKSETIKRLVRHTLTENVWRSRHTSLHWWPQPPLHFQFPFLVVTFHFFVPQPQVVAHPFIHPAIQLASQPKHKDIAAVTVVSDSNN